MSRVRNEVEGWRDALRDRETLLTLLSRLLWTALCTAGAVVGVDHAEPLVVVLVATCAALVLSLVVLRVRGRP